MEKLKVILSFFLTLGILAVIPNTFWVLLILLALWTIVFWPLSKAEAAIFLIASLFFAGQNYAVLSVGGFEFRHKDFLLMPYYEPFCWGFYYLCLKRLIPQNPIKTLGPKAIAGLLMTAASFTIFGKNSSALIVAASVSTLILFLFSHEREDWLCALTALIMGTLVEIFGVSNRLWWYPYPDWMGIPYWFVPMWLSAGWLGRRFLFPLSLLVTKK